MNNFALPWQVGMQGIDRLINHFHPATFLSAIFIIVQCKRLYNPVYYKLPAIVIIYVVDDWYKLIQ